MATLSDIYNWFMTGKKPTQAQFWASWGSFWNKGESIPQSAISNLSTVLNAKAEKSQLDGKQDKLTAGENITIDPETKVISAAIPPSENVFTSDFDYNFGAGKGLGILTGSGVYPTTGKTHEAFLREIANEYVAPVFTSFNIQSEPQTVEVGTTISGSKTFKWGITLNNGVIPTIDIFDNTAGAVLVNTPNNGTKAQAITTIKLDAKDATQSWKAIAINAAGANVNSADFVITSRFNRFWGAVDALPASPSNGAANRTYANLLSKAIKSNGANSLTLSTGTTSNKFIVLLPPDVLITSVIDTGNLNLNITSSYVLSTITIKDAGGTDRTYNQYLFNPAGAYPTSTNHVITTN